MGLIIDSCFIRFILQFSFRQLNEKLKTVAKKSPRSKPYKIPENKPKVWNTTEDKLNFCDLSAIYQQPSTSVGVNAIDQPSTSSASQLIQNNTGKRKSDMVKKWVLQHGHTMTDFHILPSQEYNQTQVKLELPEASDDAELLTSQQNLLMAATNQIVTPCIETNQQAYSAFRYYQHPWNQWNNIATETSSILDL